jgi:hypothetical protein
MISQMHNYGISNAEVWRRKIAPIHALLFVFLLAASLLWGVALITGTRSFNVELFVILLGLYALASTLFVFWQTLIGQSLFHAPIYITTVAFVEFGLASLSTLLRSKQLVWQLHGDVGLLITSLEFVMLGMVGFWGGVRFVTKFFPIQRSRARSAPGLRNSILLWAIGLYVLAIASKLYLLHSSMYGYTFARAAYYSNLGSAQMLGFASQLGLYALAILTIERFYHPSDVTRRMLFAAVLGSECLWGLISGMKAVLLFNFVLVGLVSSIIIGKIQKRWILAAIIGLIVVYPFYEQYRTLIREHGIHIRSVSTAVEVMTQAVSQVVRGDSKSTILEQGSQSTMSRVQLLDSIALIVSMGPKRAYLLGEERLWMVPIYPFVPRLLWPSKPILDIGQRFSVALGYHNTTSTAITYFGDLLLRYGTSGLIVGMFAFGFFSQYIAGKAGAGLDKRWLFIYACIFPLETDLELGAFELWTGLIKAFVVVTILGYFIYRNNQCEHPANLSYSSNLMLDPEPRSGLGFK